MSDPNVHAARLRSMTEPDQGTWDLSPDDVEAIRWALTELGRRHPPPPPPPIYREELATYERVKPDLLASAREGHYVVIKGDVVHGVGRTYDDALRIGYKACGPVPFMVKRILAVDPVYALRPG